MAVIVPDDVVPGLVAFLDHQALLSDNRIRATTPQSKPRPGPFVCFRVEGGESWWAPVTTQPATVKKRKRVQLKAEWRIGSHPQWVNVDQYLNDGANIYVGPTDAFCSASGQEVTTRTSRSRLTPDGVSAVNAEVERQKERRVQQV
jgi:hypothetical protein